MNKENQNYQQQQQLYIYPANTSFTQDLHRQDQSLYRQRPVSPLKCTQLSNDKNGKAKGIINGGNITPTKFSLNSNTNQSSITKQMAPRLSDIIRNERKQMQETSSFKNILQQEKENSISRMDSKLNFTPLAVGRGSCVDPLDYTQKASMDLDDYKYQRLQEQISQQELQLEKIQQVQRVLEDDFQNKKDKSFTNNHHSNSRIQLDQMPSYDKISHINNNLKNELENKYQYQQQNIISNFDHSQVLQHLLQDLKSTQPLSPPEFIQNEIFQQQKQQQHVRHSSVGSSIPQQYLPQNYPQSSISPMNQSNYDDNGKGLQQYLNCDYQSQQSSSMFEYTQDSMSNRQHQMQIETRDNPHKSQTNFTKDQYQLELDQMKIKFNKLEELYQSKMIEYAIELKKKDGYINKLEKQIKDITKNYNTQINTLKEDYEQKQNEIIQNKQGLKQVIEVVNSNKKLIIDDILPYVNLFDTICTPTSNSTSKSSDKVYQLLKVILETLFKKITYVPSKCDIEKDIMDKSVNKNKLLNQRERAPVYFDNSPLISQRNNYREPDKIEEELNDCHKKLKDLEKLIQINKSIAPKSIERIGNDLKQQQKDLYNKLLKSQQQSSSNSHLKKGKLKQQSHNFQNTQSTEVSYDQENIVVHSHNQQYPQSYMKPNNLICMPLPQQNNNQHSHKKMTKSKSMKRYY